MINFGEWSATDDKIRVTYKNMEESVLFEDTASISYIKITNADLRYTFGGLILGFILGFGTAGYGNSGLTFGVVAGCIILGIILGYDKEKFDTVNIETRGGKIISFAVSEGKGKAIMEQIEEAKRKWEKNKK